MLVVAARISSGRFNVAAKRRSETKIYKNSNKHLSLYIKIENYITFSLLAESRECVEADSMAIINL